MLRTLLNPMPPSSEAMTPREVRLERASQYLSWGVAASAALTVIVLVVIALGGLKIIPGAFSVLHNLLLLNFAGADDIASEAVVLLLTVNIAALMVLMAGMLAREIWSPPGLVILIVANAAALALYGFTPALLTMGFAGAALLTAARDLTAFRVNPVMLKELRGRMRGMRAFVVLTIYLGLMSAFAILLYLINASTSEAMGLASSGAIGRVLFVGVVGIELLLIIFIAPAFTAGAISGERERQTYDLLQTTLLAGPSFVIGKLESALSYILLLLVAGIPMQSIAFLFGGVSEVELIIAFAILGVTAIALGTVGIYCSSATPRTLSASVAAYTVALVITFGIPMLMSVLVGPYANAIVGYSSGAFNSAPLEAFLIYLGSVLVSMNPVTAAVFTQQLLADRQVTGFWVATLSSDGSTIPLISPWITFILFYLTVSTILIVLAIRKVRRIEG